ncbi:MAG: hypothetical protein ACLFU8_04065 [Anaerolineales bacterium]
MTKQETSGKESQVARMQRLRRAVGRLRNLRGEKPRVQRKSWLERLKARLGLSEESAE